MNPAKIAIVNRSTVLADTAIKAIIPALQKQVSTDLVSAWHVDAALSFVGLGSSPPAGTWTLTISDNTDDDAGDLGYHSSDANGPYGKVFAKTTIDSNQAWSAVISHELLEMLINPYGSLAAFIPSDDTGLIGTYYDLEICDPVYPQDQSYTISSVVVSDFVFPSWFAPWIVSPQVDQAKRVQAPLQIAPGAVVAISDGRKRTINGPASAAATLIPMRSPSTLSQPNMSRRYRNGVQAIR